MEIFGISSLTRDVKQNNLYDLFIKTYEDNTDVPFGQYTVKVEDTMRIDLVCQKIYNTTEHIDFLLSYNSIDNPLNIKEGDILYYVSPELIDEFTSEEPAQEEAKKLLTNPAKATRKDPTRQSFIEQGYTLPPNFLDVPQAPVRVEGDSLVIGAR
jgi:hypothetical protein